MLVYPCRLYDRYSPWNRFQTKFCWKINEDFFGSL